jgi:hypothetical protein
MLLLSVGALEHGMITQPKASAVEIVVDLGLFRKEAAREGAA